MNSMSYGGEAQYHLNMHWCQINFTLALHSSPSSDYMEVVAAVQGTRYTLHRHFGSSPYSMP